MNEFDRRMVKDPVEQREPSSARSSLGRIGTPELIGNVYSSHLSVKIIDNAENSSV